MSKLVLIDGNSIMNRAFYGIMSSTMLTAPDGTPTNAVYGFLAILFKILEDINPEYVGVAFDLKAPTKRHKMYTEYKANRKGMPDELAVQMPIIKDVLRAMNIEIIEKEGYEADDILGTLAKQGEKEGLSVTILTGDRDAFQLASNNITIRIPRTKAGKTEVEDFDENKIIETYGIKPVQLIEVKGLMGDSSDNIPGVAGIGEKTALSIIQEYNSIDNVYKNLKSEENTFKGKLKEKLENGEEMAYLSRELGTIDIEAKIDTETEKLKKVEWDNNKVFELFTSLRFNKYIERFNIQSTETNTETIDVEIEETEDLEKIILDIKNAKTMYFNVQTADDENEELIIKKKIKRVSIYTDKVYVTENLQALKEIFEDKEILKCGANLKEIYILLKQNGIEPANFMYDIEIAGYILNATSTKYDINSLASIYLNVNIQAKKDEGKQISLFEQEEIVDDNFAITSYCVYKLVEILTEKLKETEQMELFNNIEMPLLEVLAEMQFVGMYIDKDALIRFGEELDTKIAELTQKIYDLSGEEFNINSTKQLGEVLFEKLQLPAQKKTKSGYSTDSAVLEKLMGKHAVIESVLEYRQLNKLKSTYVSGMLPYINKKTGRIHSYFNQTITATGRISSSEPNLQNIPTRIELGKKLREVFVGENEKVLVDADYSQIELRILADIANDAKMINAFNNGHDIHREVAAEVFKTDNVTEEQRSHAKAVNFGIVYGISDFGLSEQLKISRKEAKAYIEQYLNKYEDINNFMENIIEYAKEKGFVETKFKRRRYIPELKSNNYMVRQFGSRVAMNTPIQGTAADIMKIAMINVYNKLKEANLEAKVVLQVHDEIIIETPESEMEKVKQLLQEGMQNACELKVPLKVDINSGKNWLEAK